MIVSSSAVAGEPALEVLRVHEHRVVFAVVEADVAELAERRVVGADAVEDAEVQRERVALGLGCGEVARLVLVLLVVDRLFGARARDRFEQLEARVHAPDRRRGRGDRRAHRECRRPAELQVLGEDVGGVHEEVRDA